MLQKANKQKCPSLSNFAIGLPAINLNEVMIASARQNLISLRQKRLKGLGSSASSKQDLKNLQFKSNKDSNLNAQKEGKNKNQADTSKNGESQINGVDQVVLQLDKQENAKISETGKTSQDNQKESLDMKQKQLNSFEIDKKTQDDIFEQINKQSCNQHKEKYIQYCANDKIPICEKCKKEQHKGHQTNEIKEALETQFSSISKKKTELDQEQQRTEQNLKQIKEVKRVLKQFQQN